MFDKVFKLGVNAGLALLLVVVVLVVIVLAQVQSIAQTPVGTGSTAMRLQVVPTLRSVTISSHVREFTRCHGGRHPWPATKAALGFRNAYCTVGTRTKVYPIEIKNGLRAKIFVATSNAVPADGGKEWVPCMNGASPPLGCQGPSNRPGIDQFSLKNYSRQLQTGTAITSSPACDFEFHPGSCMAGSGQLQRESLVLTGPYAPDDNSTNWSVTIIWMAVPAQ